MPPSLLVPHYQPTMGNPNPTDLYILNHVFLPPELPQEDDTKTDRDIALCRSVYHASIDFTDFLSESQQQKWCIVKEMLKTLLETTQALDKGKLAKNIMRLEEGGQSSHVLCRSDCSSSLCRSSCASYPCSKCCSHSTQASKFCGF